MGSTFEHINSDPGLLKADTMSKVLSEGIRVLISTHSAFPDHLDLGINITFGDLFGAEPKSTHFLV